MDAYRYFDNAATTPLDPRVREAMLPYFDEAFGNANSIHAWGLRAHEAVELARERVARLIGAEDPSQIYFTSGATESNNWVLKVADEIVVSPFEHSSMQEPADVLGPLRRRLPNSGPDLGMGFRTTDLDMEQSEAVLRRYAVDESEPRKAKLYRRVLEAIEEHNKGVASAQVVERPELVSVMSVNNEIGTIWHAPDYAQPGDLVHSDITQAVGKIPITVEGLDFASFSAHKFYGPKGIGALFCKDQPPPPLILGGEQERGARGGTLNVPAIVGMGAAAEIAAEEQTTDFERASLLREVILDRLNGLSDVQINGGERTSPFIVSVSFVGLEGETLVLEIDRAGYAISAGAACSSRSMEPSHVLAALHLEPEWLRGTVRVSFGRFNSEGAASELGKHLRLAVEKLRRL